MSADDQALSTGKTILEYVESKRKLATLRAEIARVAKQFEDGAQALRERAAEPGVTSEFIGLATYEKVRALTEDLYKETRRQETLLRSIREIGLDG